MKRQDKPDTRIPLTKQGYSYAGWNWALTGLGIVPKSALTWTLMPMGTQNWDGNYSWNDVRYSLH